MAKPKPPDDHGLDNRISGEAQAIARGLGFTLSEGRWSAVTRARESVEHALEGDNALLDERLSAGRATADEQKLAADLLAGRIKPRKKRLQELLAEDRRQLVAEFVKARERAEPGVKRDAVVREAEEHFGITTSEVYTSLAKARE